MRAPNWRPEMLGMRRLLAWLSAWLRWLNGDTAYAQYLRHLAAAHPERVAPSRATFYRMEIERRWQGVRRCC